MRFESRAGSTSRGLLEFCELLLSCRRPVTKCELGRRCAELGAVEQARRRAHHDVAKGRRIHAADEAAQDQIGRGTWLRRSSRSRSARCLPVSSPHASRSPRSTASAGRERRARPPRGWRAGRRAGSSRSRPGPWAKTRRAAHAPWPAPRMPLGQRRLVRHVEVEELGGNVRGDGVREDDDLVRPKPRVRAVVEGRRFSLLVGRQRAIAECVHDTPSVAILVRDSPRARLTTPATPEHRGRWTMRCIAQKRPSIASLPEPLTSERRSLSTVKSRLLPRKTLNASMRMNLRTLLANLHWRGPVKWDVFLCAPVVTKVE